MNLPKNLKQEAETWAQRQGVSLNQIILWATAEKVGALNQQMDDPRFPEISYRRGSSGIPTPVIRGTGLRVETIVTARDVWELNPAQIASEYEVSQEIVDAALSFYQEHKAEIDHLVQTESEAVGG